MVTGRWATSQQWANEQTYNSAYNDDVVYRDSLFAYQG